MQQQLELAGLRQEQVEGAQTLAQVSKNERKKERLCGPWIEILNRKAFGHKLHMARVTASLKQTELREMTDPKADRSLLSALELGQRRYLNAQNFKFLEEVCKLLQIAPPQKGRVSHANIPRGNTTTSKPKQPAKVEAPKEVPNPLSMPVAVAPKTQAAMPRPDEHKFKAALDLYNSGLLTLAEFMNVTKRIAQ